MLPGARHTRADRSCRRMSASGHGLQNLVHEAVGERLRLFLKVGLQIRRRHLESHDARLWLAVLHVPEPREHRPDLSAGGHEVRLVGESPVPRRLHVWLIFVLVVLWTAFSAAFEAVFSTMFIPLSLAALGIVFRGADFAFHRPPSDLSAGRPPNA